jgi:hypothetical protein
MGTRRLPPRDPVGELHGHARRERGRTDAQRAVAVRQDRGRAAVLDALEGEARAARAIEHRPAQGLDRGAHLVPDQMRGTLPRAFLAGVLLPPVKGRAGRDDVLEQLAEIGPAFRQEAHHPDVGHPTASVAQLR